MIEQEKVIEESCKVLKETLALLNVSLGNLRTTIQSLPVEFQSVELLEAYNNILLGLQGIAERNELPFVSYAPKFNHMGEYTR